MQHPPADYILARNMLYCNYCPGYCCYRLPGATLYLDNEDINRLARYLSISDGEVRHRFLENKNTFKTREDGSCILLANGRLCKRCTIHEARPRQCRDFPYEKPCPYLENPGLLEIIQTRVEQSLFGKNSDL